MARTAYAGVAAPLGLLAAAGTLALLLCPTASAGSPPTAIIAEPAPLTPYQTCSIVPLNASGSFDPDGGPLYYIWTLPTEVVEGYNAGLVNYTNFTTPGNYSITLTVRDNETFEDNRSVNITIKPCNTPPVAVIAAPLNGSRFFTVDFVNLSAAGSYDPDGTVLSYDWAVNGLGAGSGENRSVRLPAGTQNLTLTVHDNDGGAGTATATVFVEVDVPPRAQSPAVAPLVGFEGDAFDFSVTYFDDNGEGALQALLLVDGTPYAMAPTNMTDPRAGRGYGVRLDLPAGRHAFYVLVDDGNLTNLSATVGAPDVYTNLTSVSDDRLVIVSATVVPPAGLSVEGPPALPPAPPALVAVSPAYFVNASALEGTNFTLALSFTPAPDINASSALLMRQGNQTWQPLVAALDPRAHTLQVAGGFTDLSGVYRVFAARAEVAGNGPPSLQIAHAAGGDGYFPNSTVTFDARGSTDPENATLLFAWRFTGPGLATGWLAGPTVAVSFPSAGVYTVELQATDGSGQVATKNTTLEIRDRPAPVVDTLEEPLTLAALAGAVAVSAGLAFWWRSRRPQRKRGYDDQYGRLYSQKSMEEKEYAALFEKFAAPAEGAEPAPPESDPAAGR